MGPIIWVSPSIGGFTPLTYECPENGPYWALDAIIYVKGSFLDRGTSFESGSLLFVNSIIPESEGTKKDESTRRLGVAQPSPGLCGSEGLVIFFCKLFTIFEFYHSSNDSEYTVK